MNHKYAAQTLKSLRVSMSVAFVGLILVSMASTLFLQRAHAQGTDVTTLQLKVGHVLSEDIRAWLQAQGWTLYWQALGQSTERKRDFMIEKSQTMKGVNLTTTLMLAIEGLSLKAIVDEAHQRVLIENAHNLAE